MRIAVTIATVPLDPVREADAIGSLLLEDGRLTAEQLEAARAEAAGRGGRLATVLYTLGALDLGTLTKVLAKVHGIEAIPPERMAALDPVVVKSLPARLCVRALAVPVRRSERGLDVAFVDPSDESAIRDVSKAAGVPVTVVVAAEPLVWYVFRVHGLTDKIPRHLAPLVEELVSAGLSSAPKRTPVVPAQYEEFHTTPMGGIAPHSPDEVTTSSFGDPSAVEALDEILGAPERVFAEAEAALDVARGLPAMASALLLFARTGSVAACVLRRSAGGFEPVEGTGLLADARFAAPVDRPTILSAALAGETGFRGAVPPGSATLSLFGARAPREVLLLALRRTSGDEALLYAEAGTEPLDAAFVERMRVLSRRARSVLE